MVQLTQEMTDARVLICDACAEMEFSSNYDNCQDCPMAKTMEKLAWFALEDAIYGYGKPLS